MAYVSTEIQNLVFLMNNRTEFFNNLLKHSTKELLNQFISSIKLELSSQFMDEDDADTLYLLQLRLTNELANV